MKKCYLLIPLGKSYWKDVGTVKSLWEANMDLLDENCELDLFDYNSRFILLIQIKGRKYISPEAEAKMNP